MAYTLAENQASADDRHAGKSAGHEAGQAVATPAASGPGRTARRPNPGHRRRNGHQRDAAPGSAGIAAMTDLAGRTCRVTGGNSGIGYATAADLARRGGRVHIACRSPGRGEAAVAAMASSPTTPAM